MRVSLLDRDRIFRLRDCFLQLIGTMHLQAPSFGGGGESTDTESKSLVAASLQATKASGKA